MIRRVFEKFKQWEQVMSTHISRVDHLLHKAEEAMALARKLGASIDHIVALRSQVEQVLAAHHKRAVDDTDIFLVCRTDHLRGDSYEFLVREERNHGLKVVIAGGFTVEKRLAEACWDDGPDQVASEWGFHPGMTPPVERQLKRLLDEVYEHPEFAMTKILCNERTEFPPRWRATSP